MNEQGSAHVIIVSILSLVLISALGLLFWQNVLHKQPVAVSTNEAKISPSSSAKPKQKTYCAPVEKLCFDYPSDWTVSSKPVSPENDGVVEKIIVSDQTGKTWLKLQTGMGGLGGACGNEDNSYSKILKTHTTSVTGQYLINEAAKDYMTSTAYALSWITYSGTAKNWTINMELNDSKTARNTGRVDPCDIGLGVINGKNAKAYGLDQAGGVEFKYYTGNDVEQIYSSEAAATAALSTAEAVKAYDILQSASYK